jgi:hypothetical protein
MFPDRLMALNPGIPEVRESVQHLDETLCLTINASQVQICLKHGYAESTHCVCLLKTAAEKRATRDFTQDICRVSECDETGFPNNLPLPKPDYRSHQRPFNVTKVSYTDNMCSKECFKYHDFVSSSRILAIIVTLTRNIASNPHAMIYESIDSQKREQHEKNPSPSHFRQLTYPSSPYMILPPHFPPAFFFFDLLLLPIPPNQLSSPACSPASPTSAVDPSSAVS